MNQAEADRDIPKLLATPARVRFLSMEPLLGPVVLRRCWLDGLGLCLDCGIKPFNHVAGACTCPPAGGRLHWVIIGGESGHGARPMHPAWARSLRDQCEAAGVPFLFKQWGEWATSAEDFKLFTTPSIRVHKDGGSSPHTAFDSTCGDYCMHRAGKKSAGRLLDGVEHNAFPSKEAR